MPTDPSARIRVLVVDDSATVRRMVTDALSVDPDIEVVGTAMDPYIAKDKILALKPDVITLDLEMPRMDGLTFLRILMERHPIPVVIMSSLTQPGSLKAIEAMQQGAVEVLGKPGTSYSIGDLGPQLILKIKAAAQARLRRPLGLPPVAPPPVPVAPAPAAAAPALAETRPAPAPPPTPVVPAVPTPVLARRLIVGVPPIRPPIVGGPAPGSRKLILIGASTGGTEAIREVLQRLPGNLPPIAIVQHIPATFSRAFADRLNSLCQMEVREAKDGDEFRPGLALVAPGNFHLLVQRVGARYVARVTTGPMVWHQRPAVDLLFKSAVECAAPHTVATLLTGMGKDGAEGLLQLRQRGARTFAQSEESCVVYGMPRAANELGAAERMVPLDRMHEAILAAISQVAD
ncbi:MAG TPA: chemotaxis response regulator protein-glutamate methylesterase [Opitutaceae bacterium]|nr:chemotaxis response regulator protein-glutamate methylesterase [Opitutaceae bacterium]